MYYPRAIVYCCVFRMLIGTIGAGTAYPSGASEFTPGF